MSIRKDFLERALGGYLARRSPPQSLKNNEAAISAELEALVDAVVRWSPRERYDEWWNLMEVKLAEDAKTRAWPTEGEIKSASMAIRPTKKAFIAEAGDFDPVSITAEKMLNGDPVGDGWIYGARAWEVSGHVGEDVMRRYRSALFFRLKDVYGQEEAGRMEADMKLRHEKCKPTGGGGFSAPKAPDKRHVESREWDFAE